MPPARLPPRTRTRRLADEQSITTALKERKLQVDSIDLAPFRASADKIYAESDMAKDWDQAWMKRVATTA